MSVKGSEDSRHGVMRLRIIASAVHLQRRTMQMNECYTQERQRQVRSCSGRSSRPQKSTPS
jgi:hypothetical protein